MSAERCESCYGTGVTFVRDSLPHETTDPCPDCDGTGQIELLPYDEYPELMHDARSGR